MIDTSDERVKEDLLSRAVGAAVPGSRAAADPAATQELLRLYYLHVASGDIVGRDPADVLGAAEAQRSLASDRPRGTTRVRLYTPSREEDGWECGHSVVEIVVDDMPFLLDSVTAELGRHGCAVHLVVHPLLTVRRGPGGELVDIVGCPGNGEPLSGGDGAVVESWMHVEIDRQDDAVALARVGADLERVLGDVRRAVLDWPAMRAAVLSEADRLTEDEPEGVDPDEVAEAAALLRWLADDHFTLLGLRDVDLVEEAGGPAARVVPGSELGIMRPDGSGQRRFAELPGQLRGRAAEPAVLVLTKASARSTVHKPVALDYVGVKRFDGAGRVTGERRLLGLFTHAAYGASVQRIPVVRRRVQEVLDRSGYTAVSHSGKDLLEILETYPREELFQTGAEDLLSIAVGVLRLQDRRRIRLFLRRDDYARFVSCLVYLPRDRYTTPVRLRFQEILREELGGATVDYTARVTESPLALLHVIVRAAPGVALREVDPDEVGLRLAVAARSWTDDLADAVEARCGESRAPALLARYGDAFPEAYKEDFPARTAVDDLCRLEALASPEDFATNLSDPLDSAPGDMRLKLYRVGEPISLSRVLPILQRMGVEVVDERPYGIDRRGADRAWVYDFGLRSEGVSPAPAGPAPAGAPDLGPEAVRARFEEAFGAAWVGDAESDGFNALVLRAGLSWRQAMVLRTYARYLRQIGLTFSQDYVERSLVAHAGVARLLVEYFESRLDPARRDGEAARSARIGEEISGALDQVPSLDQDRILRSYRALIGATHRTNYFQRRPGGGPKPYLSVKLDPRAVPDLPAPRPRFEIFVCSPRTEGVHLRFGAVARGGIRWSDRREDFRTEILGLAKAQMVKNAVIVPAGAKGGFYCKQLPDPADRDAWLAEGVACYRTLICGLLDVTDNLVDGAVVPPPDVVRRDGDDTYLVVAADKGTATFSDIANGIAKDYGYWLGDAFASGGSVGYDHKEMGITARGAWESVKSHFRALDVEVDSEQITCVGIGDMSGDVFGNGMLLSRHIRLLAAFDHRDIFLDPSPDPAASFAERQRLYRLPRSSWADYDPALISEGGGVHPRTAKSVPVSGEARAALGIAGGPDVLTPADLIRAILRAPVDLLWNGGIGTYVKSTTETHADVGDKSNDALRVDATELRCKVVGEGGNLGLTQRARVQLALGGGRVNTDFIDNSAGVDTSDHEVNIKVLLDRAVADGSLAEGQRNEMLASMTDEVAALVLRDNHDQNVALSTALAQAPEMLEVHGRHMAKLEREGHLDRALEALPDSKVLAERSSAGIGLTGPELAVLLSQSKIALEGEILDSDLPEDPYLRDDLYGYFPAPLRETYRERMDSHPLRREIVTTCVVNDMVNNGGTTFAFRLNEETGATAADIARAYTVARVVFGMGGYWQAVDALSDRAGIGTQSAMLLEGRRLVDRSTRWLLHHRRSPLEIAPAIEHLGRRVADLLPVVPGLLQGNDRRGYGDRRERLTSAGVPAELAGQAAVMVPAYSTLDIVEVATALGRRVAEVAEVYFDLADRLGIARLRERIVGLRRDDRWHSMARNSLRDDLYAAHATLTRQVLEGGPSGTRPERLFESWMQRNAGGIARSQQTLGELEELSTYDMAILSVALRVLRTLVASSSLPGTG